MAYTLEHIADRCYSEISDSADEPDNGTSTQNVSNFFSRFFRAIGLESEWRSLMNGRKYSFSEDQAGILVDIFLHREQLKDRDHPDYELLFDIRGKVLTLFGVEPPFYENEIYQKTEGYLTRVLTQNFRADLQEYYRKLINLHFNGMIINTDQKHFLHSYDKFLWIQAFQSDLCKFVESWRSVFERMEELCEERVHNEINKQYESDAFAIFFRSEALYQTRADKDKKLRQLKSALKNETSDKKRRLIQEMITATDAKIREKANIDIITSYPIPRVSSKELLIDALEAVQIQSIKDSPLLRDPKTLAELLGIS